LVSRTASFTVLLSFFAVVFCPGTAVFLSLSLHDALPILIDSFVKWRISDPRLFYVTFGANDRAAVERLTAQIRDALNASVNVRTVKEVVSNERDTIMREILTNVEARAKPLGVQVVDVRLRRIDFAPEISESVYRRLEAERKQEANRPRATGAADSERLRAPARAQRLEEQAR